MNITRYYLCTCTHVHVLTFQKMGNRKNKTKPNAGRGKFKKHTPLKQWEGKMEHKPSALEGNRIINLEQLAGFVSNISHHSQSCQLGTISLSGESY